MGSLDQLVVMTIVTCPVSQRLAFDCSYEPVVIDRVFSTVVFSKLKAKSRVEYASE